MTRHLSRANKTEFSSEPWKADAHAAAQQLISCLEFSVCNPLGRFIHPFHSPVRSSPVCFLPALSIHQPCGVAQRTPNSVAPNTQDLKCSCLPALAAGSSLPCKASTHCALHATHTLSLYDQSASLQNKKEKLAEDVSSPGDRRHSSRSAGGSGDPLGTPPAPLSPLPPTGL